MKFYTIPVFHNSDYHLIMEEAVHPLLDNPVPNSIEIKENGIIITGSNMSGKSTFLRTLGINVLFSQTIVTTLTLKYQGNFLNIVTSISNSDSISQGKSFYYAECERLLKIVQHSQKQSNSLFLIDELLSETNYQERISASEEILKYIINKYSYAVITTHDIEITKELGKNYKCYHFTDHSEAKNLCFDYKIKDGVAKTTNAIKVMDYLGYPEDIVKNAIKKVKRIVT